MLKLLFSFALLLATVASQAQSIFDVEIVFFKRINDLHLKGQEQPIPLTESSAQYSIGNSESQLPPDYQVLERSEQKLEGVFHRLKTSSDMRPLLHVGWRQPLYDKAETPWISFKLQDDPELPGLVDFNGLIRFSRNQGLLVENQVVGYRQGKLAQQKAIETIELDTDNKATQETLNLLTDNDERQEQNDATDEDFQVPDELSGFFEMSETLKVKLDKLYYIDHPTMGLLIKVTPYQASLEEQDALN
ncbi:CsiV family protein [Kangiella shandongensis]|uniref:CsiV family protein n=1 Tax=Kangiella shandongensis TaxID=2763258 RepID=UPI001CBE9138|nr:CsiV family protein [Kangiella shandongensis]